MGRGLDGVIETDWAHALGCESVLNGLTSAAFKTTIVHFC